MFKTLYPYSCLKFLTIAAIVTLLSGCAKTQYTQCEQIFNIARQVTNKAEAIADTPKEPLEMETWLEVANLMDAASRQLEALPVENIQLIEYKTELANVYQIYAAATLDALKAREVKDLAALKKARDRASSAGELQQKAVAQINAYCLNK